jgi:hypothetical protein
MTAAGDAEQRGETHDFFFFVPYDEAIQNVAEITSMDAPGQERRLVLLAPAAAEVGAWFLKDWIFIVETLHQLAKPLEGGDTLSTRSFYNKRRVGLVQDLFNRFAVLGVPRHDYDVNERAVDAPVAIDQNW